MVLLLGAGLSQAADGDGKKLRWKLKPGDLPPDFVGKTIGGDELRLAAFSGKAVVVSYWATWCPYCLQELPVLNNIQRLAGSDKLAVLAVNVEDRDTFRKARRALSSVLDVHMGFDPTQQGREGYGVNGLPYMVIIGRDGRIVRAWAGYSEDSLDNIVADINQAMAEPQAR